jgi:hypothetical protein
MVRKLNIDGDGQADLAGHGGERALRICLPIGIVQTLAALPWTQ